MVRDDPSPTRAIEFCEWLIKNHGKDLPNIRPTCYHALGHGFTPEPTDVETWGDPRAMTSAAITACSVIEQEDIRQECLQGTFNVVGDWMWTNQFGLRFPQEDSLSLCRTFDNPEAVTACYYELSMRINALMQDSIPATYNKYLAAIKDDATVDMIMGSVGASVVGANITKESFIPYLKECRLLPERVQVGCLKGLSAGFMAHGEPGQEYVKAIAFCGDTELTEPEKTLCYWNIIRTLRGSYTPEKMSVVCELVEPKYQNACGTGGNS